MDLAANLAALIEEYGRRKAGREVDDLVVAGGDAWDIQAGFMLGGAHRCELRPLRNGDVGRLEEFGRGLGERSRNLFSCHPWLEAKKLQESLQGAIDNSTAKTDASYLMLMDGKGAGFYFLWKAGHNAHSAAYGLEIPELGIAITDAYHGWGLGGLLMRFLQLMARGIGSDAVELTTGMTNEQGYRTYVNVGFEQVGVIANPLHVDVAAFAAGEVRAASYRQERQMVWVVNEKKRKDIMAYMAAKREHMEQLCAGLERDRYEEGGASTHLN